MLLQLYNHYYILRFFGTQTGVAKKICSYVWVCMSTSQVMSAFKPHPSANFSPSYFHVIPGHPSVCLSSLLSFGTHHRLHEIVVPHSSVPKLYDSWVRTKHYPTLNTLIAKVEPVNEEDIRKKRKRNPSPSHCIHRLCISSSITTPICTPNHSITHSRNS